MIQIEAFLESKLKIAIIIVCGFLILDFINPQVLSEIKTLVLSCGATGLLLYVIKNLSQLIR